MLKVLLLIVFSTEAHAIVGDRMSMTEPKDGLGGAFDTNLYLSTGNIDLLDLGVRGSIAYQKIRPDKWFDEGVSADVSYRIAQKSGSRYLNSWFAALRYYSMFHHNFGVLGFVQYEFNEFRKLDSRTVFGGAPTFVAFPTKNLTVWGSVGPMLEYETIDVSDGSTDDPRTLIFRWASSVMVKYVTDSKKMAVQNSIYFQPRIDGWNDLRVLNTIEVKFPLGKYVTAGLSLDLRYDSEPPTAVKSFDTALTHRLSFVW